MLTTSCTIEKVVFDWESELRELETDGTSINDIVRNYALDRMERTMYE